ncbi:MAG: MlaD family protein [Fibromonadaceae bacterium]|jgi:phospholipid/cholesterol/gamma-HCH transport system substrate-binding protein|nr:MlaD family protein [Fibromonadaceae bacterium]
MFKFLRYVNWSELSGLMVGAALAVVICVSTYILVKKLDHEGIIGKKEYNIYSKTVSAQGLRKGTAVQINGVAIGRVDDISIAKDGLVELKFAIDAKYQELITDKSIVYATRDNNILSERVMNVDISQKSNKFLAHNDYIKAGTARDLETVLTTTNELVGRIGELVTMADTLLRLIVDTNTTVGMLLGSKILYDNLDHAAFRISNLIVDLDSLVGSADYLLGAINEGVPRAKVFADTISTSVVGLMGTLGNLAGSATNTINTLDTTILSVGSVLNDFYSVMGTAGNLILDGSQTLNRTDDVMGGLSKFWFVRGKIPQKDSIPLLGEAW